MRKKNKYLVGFDDDLCTVYGLDEKTIGGSQVQWANPMTLGQAKWELKKLSGGNPVIYELKVVKGNGTRCRRKL